MKMPLRPFPFDTQRFRHDEGLTTEQFAMLIKKDMRHVVALEQGEVPGLSSWEHGRLCRRFGREKIACYYALPKYATKS